MQSQQLTKLQKVIPKGAQSKFSAQKSFLRECRAKKLQSKVAKVVPKGAQRKFSAQKSLLRELQSQIPPKYKVKKLKIRS